MADYYYHDLDTAEPEFGIEDDEWDLLSIIFFPVGIPFSMDSVFMNSVSLEDGVVGVMLRRGPQGELNRQKALDMLRLGAYEDLTCNEQITFPYTACSY